MTRALLGASLAGLLGAALWAAVAFLFHVEIGWIAWGIGLACGFGAARLGERLDWTTGAAAAGIAVLSIALGKFAAVHLAVGEAVEEIAAGQFVVTEELAVSYVADDVVAARYLDGQRVDWPGGVEPSNPTERSEYPADVWAEALVVWNELPADERAAFRAELARNLRDNAERMRGGAVEAGFRDSFSAFDLLFVALAISSAYKLGSGATAQA